MQKKRLCNRPYSIRSIEERLYYTPDRLMVSPRICIALRM